MFKFQFVQNLMNMYSTPYHLQNVQSDRAKAWRGMSVYDFAFRVM